MQQSANLFGAGAVPILSVFVLLVMWYGDRTVAITSSSIDEGVEGNAPLTSYALVYILTTLVLYVRLVVYLRAFRSTGALVQ